MKITQEILHEIEWYSFEKLCEEYIRHEGFKPIATNFGQDGGIDIYIHDKQNNEILAIVQCKAWKSKQAGVSVVREMRGVMAAENIDQGIVMTSGVFSDAAKEFGAKNNVALINGIQLMKEINNLSADKLAKLTEQVLSGDYKTPTCPTCKIKMKLREGKNLWGCVNYPKCKQNFHTKQLTDI